MTWYTNKFSNQYAEAQKIIKSETFSEDWAKVIRELKALMTDSGFDPGKAGGLDDLRKRVARGKGSGNGAAEADEILAGVGINNPKTANPALPMALKLRQQAAALKFLRHVYLVKKFGSHRAWVHALPSDIAEWPHFGVASNPLVSDVRRFLNTSNEKFSAEDRKNLSNATQHALRWCHRAGSTISSAKTSRSKGSRSSNAARDKVKRWFADETTTETELDTFIGKLDLGFKAITATITRGHMVFTDFVPLRNATTQDELDLLSSEAFVWPLGGREALDVVYIEQEFFGKNNVLTGVANWARIIVHELSHLVVGTEDISAGAQARYAWYGIAPNAGGFPGSDAIRNAENWAFFAGDCASSLSDSERLRALTVR